MAAFSFSFLFRCRAFFRSLFSGKIHLRFTVNPITREWLKKWALCVGCLPPSLSLSVRCACIAYINTLATCYARIQWYAKFEIEWTIATLLIFIVYFFLLLLLLWRCGPLLSLLALFALYNLIFIIVHKFLLLLCMCAWGIERPYRLLVGVFFIVRGLVREQKEKRTSSSGKVGDHQLSSAGNELNENLQYIQNIELVDIDVSFSFLYISIARWNWNTGEISRCWKRIIPYDLMTFRPVLFLFSRCGPCNDRTTSISSASDDFSSNSLFTRVLWEYVHSYEMYEKEKWYFWLILIVIVGSQACWLAGLCKCIASLLCVCVCGKWFYSSFLVIIWIEWTWQ